jgi:HD-GYP domain-containing protein (c-di-GMP phosphodiesterase class II)
MASTDFFAARTFSFSHMMGPLAFDVYLRLGTDKFTKVFSRGLPIENDRLQSYIMKGTEFLYIRGDERTHFLTESMSVLQQLQFERAFDKPDTQQIIDELAENSLQEVFTKKTFDNHTQYLVHTVVDSYVDIAAHQVHVFPALLKLAKKKPTLVKHMIMTSIFSTLLAKACDPRNRELMFVAGYSGFVHDIGLAVIKHTKDESSFDLSPQERRDIEKHPAKGAELLSFAANVSDKVEQAVLQHHEGYDGTGYPRGLRKDQITIAARIVHLAEKFTTLLSGHGFSSTGPLNPLQAVQILSKDGKIDPNLLNIFIKLLKL